MVKFLFQNKICCFSVFFLLLCSIAFAQTETKNGRDMRSLNDTIEGIREFNYVVKGNDTILQGPFKFKSIHYEENKNSYVRTLSFKGDYNADKKTNEWVFSRKKIQKDLPFVVDDYRVIYNSSGSEFKVVARFDDGEATGEWIAMRQEFENSTPTDTLYLFKTSFKNARMFGDITGFSEKIDLKGQFNEEGFLHGKWELIHKIENNILQEVRIFENGVFKEHYFEYEDRRFEIDHVGFDTTKDIDEDNWVEVGISDDYFDIFQFTNFGFKENESISIVSSIREISTNSNQFLENSLLSFGSYDDFDIWQLLSGNESLQYGKFKVRKYNYQRKELKAIESIQENFAEIKELISYYSQNSTIEIAVVSYEELAKYAQIVKVYEANQKELEAFVNKIVSPTFQYVQREKILPFLAPNINFKEELTYKFQDEQKSFSYAFPETLKPYNYDLEGASIFYAEIYKSLKEIVDDVREIESDFEKQEGLAEKESELIKKRDRLYQLFEGKLREDDFNMYHKDIAQILIEEVEKKFNTYAKLSLDDKQDEVDSYIECLSVYDDLYDVFQEIPSKKSRIKEVYTRTVFNPFMMTDISEMTKERVYNAYDNILFPFVIDLVKEDLSCANLESRLDNFSILHKAMLEIREQDTKEEEKQLRREKRPQTILDILSIKLNQ